MFLTVNRVRTACAQFNTLGTHGVTAVDRVVNNKNV